MDNVHYTESKTQVSFRPKVRLEAIASLPIKLTYRQTLLAIDSFVNSKSGKCFPGLKAIARRRGRTTRTIQHHLKKLEGLGLIKRLARFAESGRQQSNLFEPTYVQLAHPFVSGVSDTGQRQPRKVSPSPPQNPRFFHPSNQSSFFEPKPKKDTLNPQQQIQGDHSLPSEYRRLLQDFFDTDRTERGLVYNNYSFEANRGSREHQKVCDRMRWAWREEA